jgi:NDP-sugar pyrophosphorylase family protein
MSSQLGYPPNYPKHLLQTGDGQTLLGRITDQAMQPPLHQRPVICTNPDNADHIKSAIGDKAIYDDAQYMFSMDPMYYALRRRASEGIGGAVLGCAGDVYSEFTWAEMLTAHHASGADMSLLVQKPEQGVKAAVFDVDPQSSRITALSRPAVSPEGAVTNVGAYVIEPTDTIMSILERMLATDARDSHDDDRIFQTFVQHGVVGAIEMPDRFHTNVNTEHQYHQLTRHLGSRMLASTGGLVETG